MRSELVALKPQDAALPCSHASKSLVPTRSTLHIMDVLVWRGYALHDCTAEFRMFWMQASKHCKLR
jgi:hypothetical protein